MNRLSSFLPVPALMAALAMLPVAAQTPNDAKKPLAARATSVKVDRAAYPDGQPDLRGSGQTLRSRLRTSLEFGESGAYGKGSG